MHWLTLPEPRKNISLAFHDPATAKQWLASQPQAQPMHMLAAISTQIEAIEAAALPPAVAVELLGLLRKASVAPQDAIEPRYVRKALPMLDDDQFTFEVAQRLWTRLGTAYLRLAPHFPADEKAPLLHRAACAIRMAEYCHFLAARECPDLLDHLLFAILDQAHTSGLLHHSASDKDFRHLGDMSIGGHLAWAFMLRLLDPYRLSAPQLAVANRALSRWRELVTFQVIPSDHPDDHSVDIAPLFGGPLPEGMPHWIEVRKVTRKIVQRISALKAGESPESLKLGRELSATAAIRLLHDIEASLESHLEQHGADIGEIELAFGAEFAYAAFTGEMIVQEGALELDSASLAHQRTAIFGFDQVTSLKTAVKKLNVPSENWLMVDGKAIRPADRKGARRQSPCLIASTSFGPQRLGVMVGLQSIAGGALAADLHWYNMRTEAGRLARQSIAGQTAPVVPVFLLHDGHECSLIVPATAGIRLETGITLEGTSLAHVMPTEVLERGVDFVRYAIHKQ